jgi:hypothetical protein
MEIKAEGMGEDDNEASVSTARAFCGRGGWFTWVCVYTVESGA